MHSKKILFSNFSHALFSNSYGLRPDNEQELTDYIAQNYDQSILVRGSGLSYNDSCFNTDGWIIDSKHLNHLIDFDPHTGIAVCQAGVRVKDLFLLHPDFIPPVIPGTLHATVGGCVAHDVHGKNNHLAGSFGHHLLWFELLIGDQKIECNAEKNTDLFYATLAGLGLTGVITRVALRLKKASRFVEVQHQKFTSLPALTEAMSTYGLKYDYQVAWLDLLNKDPVSVLALANHCPSFPIKKHKTYTVPKVPFCVINSWSMSLFNRVYYKTRKARDQLELQQFNNPLDKINHWNRLYGRKGLIQFQAVLTQNKTSKILQRLISLIKEHQATPTLAVLKYFTQTGKGKLSFCKPGFTLAVDFIHNQQSKQAIAAMNQLMALENGRVYLAKDLLLTEEQYRIMYPQWEQYEHLLRHFNCTLHSDLGKRLGILK